MPPDCLAWQPGDVFVCGGFDGYGMTRRNVGYLPIYSRFQSTCHIRGMTSSAVRSTTLLSTFQSTCHIRGMTGRILPFRRRPRFQSTCHIRGMTANRAIMQGDAKISIHMPHTWHDLACFHVVPLVLISIHMPHTWHDVPDSRPRSTDTLISIHMPHTWHDAPWVSAFRFLRDFNPHATYVA